MVLPEPGLETRLTTKTPAARELFAQGGGRDEIVLFENVFSDFD